MLIRSAIATLFAVSLLAPASAQFDYEGFLLSDEPSAGSNSGLTASRPAYAATVWSAPAVELLAQLPNVDAAEGSFDYPEPLLDPPAPLDDAPSPPAPTEQADAMFGVDMGPSNSPSALPVVPAPRLGSCDSVCRCQTKGGCQSAGGCQSIGRCGLLGRGQMTGHCQSAGDCQVPPYRQPLLPPPYSLRGYFNASPCEADVWAGYACEAAANCREHHHVHGGRPLGRPAADCGCRP